MQRIVNIVLVLAASVSASCASNKPGESSDALGGRGAMDPDAGGGARSRDSAALVGAPIEGDSFEWIWVDVPGAICRDGSATGFGVNMNHDSDKLVLYYEGGGACYNAITCTISPPAASADDFMGPMEGIFNRNMADNPVKDWNVVYFPYCSGDVYGGDSVADPGIGEQQFHGYRNVDLFLDRVAAAFPNVTQIFATGVSAGAIGVGATAELIAEKFPKDVTFSMIADSCAPMDAEYIPECLQERWRELWNFDETFLADCGADCSNRDNFMVDLIGHLLKTYDDRQGTAGILTSVQDPIIGFFYGFGNNDCNPESSLAPSLPAEQFRAGVMDLRSRMEAYPRFGTYFVEAADHGFMNVDSKFYGQSAGGVRLVDWAREIIEGSASHVGP